VSADRCPVLVDTSHYAALLVDLRGNGKAEGRYVGHDTVQCKRSTG